MVCENQPWMLIENVVDQVNVNGELRDDEVLTSLTVCGDRVFATGDQDWEKLYICDCKFPSIVTLVERFINQAYETSADYSGKTTVELLKADINSDGEVDIELHDLVFSKDFGNDQLELDYYKFNNVNDDGTDVEAGSTNDLLETTMRISFEDLLLLINDSFESNTLSITSETMQSVPTETLDLSVFLKSLDSVIEKDRY